MVFSFSSDGFSDSKEQLTRTVFLKEVNVNFNYSDKGNAGKKYDREDRSPSSKFDKFSGRQHLIRGHERPV